VNFAWVLRRWMAQQASANLRERAAQAVQQGLGAQSGAEEATPGVPPRCDVGIVFALVEESGGTEDLLSAAVTTKGDGFVLRQGLLAERNVVLIRAGAGRVAAARATQALIGGHRPEWVISAGFAGGLQPALRRGDIVMANEVLDISSRRLALDLQAASDPRAGLHVGRLLTVDQIIREPAEKAALGQTHQALAVDMESWAVGEVCRQDKVRFMAIRVISDSVEDALPADLGRLMAPKSTAGRVGAVAGTLFRRPSSIKDMLRLREEALIASDRLAKFLANVVQQLAPGRAP